VSAEGGPTERPAVDVSVFMATYRRPEILTRTLEGFASLEPAGPDWRLLILDNADDPATREVVRGYDGRVPLEYLLATGPGKNHALNVGLGHATGDVFVFVDDDAVPRPDWLREMLEGIARWPDATMFGGRIDPVWPAGHEGLDLSNDFLRGLLTISSWGEEEGPLPWFRVWGPNMAFRASVFEEGMRFDPTIGPTSGDFVLGAEVEFTKRLAEAGHRSVYLPRAVVGHQVRPEQLDGRWLSQRAYRLGRGVARLHGLPAAPRIFGVPRFVYREITSAAVGWAAGAFTRDRDRRLHAKLQGWHWYGKLTEYRTMTE
jgi:glucosyl-dolichyl phosphate glucuronosyltransferase